MAAVSPAAADNCNADQLNVSFSLLLKTVQVIRACYQPFFAGYNVSLPSDSWPSYWPFHDIRKALLNAQGLAVQPYVCQWVPLNIISLQSRERVGELRGHVQVGLHERCDIHILQHEQHRVLRLLDRPFRDDIPVRRWL